MKTNIENIPAAYPAIDAATRAFGFKMASDMQTGSLLRTLAVTKPAGRFLELGTGTGLATAWILDGMDKDSTLTTVDNDRELLSVAEEHLGKDDRLQLVHEDGEAFLLSIADEKYDYIFADTWHGKYLLLDETLELLDKGGLYIVDDMLPQLNWPEGHAEKAKDFERTLIEREDLVVTKQDWASGIIIAVKK